MRSGLLAAAFAVAASFAAMGVNAQLTPEPAATPAIPAAIEKLPASAFARLPFVEDVRLSPNGQYMAGLFGVNGEQRLAIMPVIGDRSGATMMAIPDKVQISSIQWVNDDYVIMGLRLLMPFDGTDFYVQRYWSVERVSGKVNRLLWDQYGQSARLLWVPHDGSTEVLIAAQGSLYLHDKEFWPSVFRVDVATGKKSVVQEGRTSVQQWGADQAGNVRFGISYSDASTRATMLYRSENGGSLRPIDRAILLDDEELDWPFYFFPGTERALQFGYDDQQKRQIQDVDLLTGETKVSALNPEGVTIEGVRLSHDRNTVLGVETPNLTHWIDPAMVGIQTQLNSASPRSTVDIISINQGQSRMLVRIATPDNPGLLFFFDASKGNLSRLTSFNDVIGGKRLSRAKLITYKARDGLEIEAVVTLPRGREAKALPFIVMPHGGPWAHDTLSYDYWAQYLAELGYGVIQPNFRGSTGYGQAFIDKGHGQMGLAMQNDLNDALAWAVGEGLADPKRACIVGASYGGYAAMWGVARDPDHYRCAVSIAGVSNLRKEVSDFGGWNLARSQWGKMSADFVAISPINFVERIKVPMLLIHGKKDVTVDVAQSDRMHAAMRKAGKSVEYLALPLADHYFTREADRLALLESMGAFLKQHNPPD